MAQGSLLFPVAYQFVDDNGTPLNAGKLYAFRSTTATPQDTFSDSALQVANAHPIVLNSAGRSATKIFGNPASGFDYTLTLQTSASVQVWSHDDIVVDGADTATLAEGSFTGTLTGMTGATTGTVNYRVTANSAGTGKFCALWIDTDIAGTSNTTALTMTGLPAAATPAVTRNVKCWVTDENLNMAGAASVGANSVITFYIEVDDSGTGSNKNTLSATGFLNSSTKGLNGGWSITYPL